MAAHVLAAKLVLNDVECLISEMSTSMVLISAPLETRASHGEMPRPHAYRRKV